MCPVNLHGARKVEDTVTVISVISSVIFQSHVNYVSKVSAL